MAYDLVIEGGTIVDGTGAEPFRGDVAVQGDRIATVGDVDGDGARTIDADGRYVTPGFVDIHTHVGQIMDASLPTFFLSHWVRDRGTFSVEEGVRRLTSDTAAVFGIRDRGVVREGAFADLNVLDLDALRLPLPEYVHDFPGGAGRFVQRGAGYDCTVVNGRVFMQGGEHTGELAGTVLRSTA